jgi:hypothetical protein
MRAAQIPMVAPMLPKAGAARRPGNLTQSQRGKIWLAIIILSVLGWAAFYGAAVLVCRWVGL